MHRSLKINYGGHVGDQKRSLITYEPDLRSYPDLRKLTMAPEIVTITKIGRIILRESRFILEKK